MLKKIRKGLISGAVQNSTVASQPCPSGHITAGKRFRYTSRPNFLRYTLFSAKP